MRYVCHVAVIHVIFQCENVTGVIHVMLENFSSQHLKIYGTLRRCDRSNSCHICRSDSCQVLIQSCRIWAGNQRPDQWVSRAGLKGARTRHQKHWWCCLRLLRFIYIWHIYMIWPTNSSLNIWTTTQGARTHHQTHWWCCHGCCGLYILHMYMWHDHICDMTHELIIKHIGDAAYGCSGLYIFTHAYVTWLIYVYVTSIYVYSHVTHIHGPRIRHQTHQRHCLRLLRFIHIWNMYMWRESFMCNWHIYTAHEFDTKHIIGIACGCSGLYICDMTHSHVIGDVWMPHVADESVMSHVNASCHIYTTRSSRRQCR